MSSDENQTAQSERTKWSLVGLAVLAALLTAAYAILAALSYRFTPDVPLTERPILPVLGLFAFAFGCYCVAICVALRVTDGKPLLAVIVLASILFRAVSLYSWPILEIDIYRYLWDGAVVVEGVSPYRYSPQQVHSETPHASTPDDLGRLVDLRDQSPAVETILSRIHYAELPTVYPPVSQAVFAAVVSLTPARVGVFERIVIMKAVFVLFDLVTLGVVVGLLRLTRKHVGWSLAYGWCPLVVKEIANTGHLDSLAVFLTMLALFSAVKPLVRRNQVAHENDMEMGQAPIVLIGASPMFAAAALLALAVGAKLYPVVLIPLFAALWTRTFGWRWALSATVVCLVLGTAILWPMIPASELESPAGVNQPAEVGAMALPPPLIQTSATQSQDPSRGLKAFLRRWEMNDFLFMLAVENLKPTTEGSSARVPWFSIFPQAWRLALLRGASVWLDVDNSRAAFLVTRLATAIAFVFVLATLIWRARNSFDPAVWLRAAFLGLAWFWLLSPTQNPWYWIWALPLVMFAGSRSWLAVSGLTLIYYSRFWLAYHWPDQPVPGTSYPGEAFFDYIVTWLEFGPWFAWLTWNGWQTSMTRRSDPV